MKTMETITEVLKANLYIMEIPIVYYYVDYMTIRKEVLTTAEEITKYFSTKVVKEQGTIRYDVLFKLMESEVGSGDIIILTDNEDTLSGSAPAPITLISSTYNEQNDLFVRGTAGEQVIIFLTF
jgi:hypothetical protein